jgi:ATP-dependent helicase/nuclease subunit A
MSAPRLAQAWAPDEEPLALERNLALLAGAGAGKTYSLITICLHLLGGARRDGVPLRAHELFLLTFTEKAAAEMRERLRARVDRLARDPAAVGEEKELVASYARHGRTPPPPDFWRKVRDDLGGATIGTFHSLCVQLLRRAPAGAGVDPAFDLLEERDAQALLQDAAERVVLDALEADPGDEVAALCRDLRFVGQGRSEGLVDYLCDVFSRVREEGLRPSTVKVGRLQDAREAFDAEVRRYRAQVADAARADAAGKQRFTELLGRVARAADGLCFENFGEPDRWPLIRDAVSSDLSLSRVKDVKAVKFLALGKKDDGEVGLCGHFAACLAARQEEAFRALLVRLEARHGAELQKRAALDFTALLIKARDLLRDLPAFRREVQDRLRALLVDEFQDTNRLQLELVTLLAEQREGAPRRVVDGAEGDEEADPGQLGLGLDERRGAGIPVEAVPLQPGVLAAVGDRKQSIYEFRGADVSVFEVLARQIERDGGARHFLQDNRRSSPELIGWFNEAFAGVMGTRENARDYEVAWDAAADALRAVRPTVRAGAPAVERLVYTPLATSEECRLQDADAVARRLAALLSVEGPACVVDRAGGQARRARGGDVAILFRRFTYLEAYRQALVRHNVPHRVVRGRGFYGAQEVMDLASLLGLVADPRDALSLAAVLRSPLVALSDASLFALAWASGQRLSLDGLRAGEKWEALPGDERARLERFVRLFPTLRRERDRLGVRVLLEVALEETGFRAAMAGTPYGEQALANLEKLLELAARRDAAGGGDAAGFARELLALAEAEPNEAQADVLDATDPRAVQLLTIHRAKGLEWPVVVVPDLASRRNFRGGRVVFDRRLGLAVKPWLPDELQPTSTARYLGVCAERSRREQAEAARTLYVALTRARDLLILSGQSPRPVAGSWRQALDALVEERPALKDGTCDLFVEEIPAPKPAPPQGGPGPEACGARARAAILRARRPANPAPRRLVLPVTQLQDYFLCPRRYLYAHEVGLSEHPMVFEVSLEETPTEGGGARGDPRARGTLAHRLLETVDLEAARAGGAALRAHLETLLWREGESPKDRGSREILEEVEAFLGTRFFAALAGAGPARVHRELPFLLRLPEVEGLSLHVKGKIDLLFEEEGGGALVLDYKFSRRHPAGLSPYRFQLDCYGLAARQLVKDGVPIRAGIAFLREGRVEPDIRPAGDAADAAAFAHQLALAGRRLLASSQRFEWQGLEVDACREMRCGYQYRCHPAR